MSETDIARMERRLAQLKKLRDPLTREMLTLRSQLRVARLKAEASAAKAARPKRIRGPAPKRRPIDDVVDLAAVPPPRRSPFYGDAQPRAGR